jgi:hypothetical protein
MNAPPLVIITTRLPPAVCGIGTYSWLLHQHWPAQNAPAQFLVMDGATDSVNELQFQAVSEFKAQPSKLSALLGRAGAADVLLHYAGRAYQRFGCPLWLPPVLRNWKTKFPAGRLVIFFHELPGNNFPITSRFFWIDRCNRRIVGQLAQLADAVATNTAAHVATIRRISGGTDASLVPVGSNIEPPANYSGEKERTEFAIFGLPFGRWQTLEMFEHEIRDWQQNGVMTKLHLIGPRDEKFDRRADRLISQMPHPDVAVRHGFLAAEEVSRLLSWTQFGLTNATAANWSKSSGLMAYAAHGCAIIGKVKSEIMPLRLMISPEQLSTISDADLNRRTTLIREWYRENADWSSTARKIAGLFTGRAEKVKT